MWPKKNNIPEGYYDFTVFPLESIWDLAEEARTMELLDKNRLIYTIMIRQSDFVTDKFAQEVINSVKSKKPYHLLDQVRFDRLEEGLCVQMLHNGPYDDEPESFLIMEDYCTQNNTNKKWES